MKNIGLFVNTTKREAIACTEAAARITREKGMNCYVSPEVYALFSAETKKLVEAHEYSHFDKYVDAIVSFGGDGTMLGAAKEFLTAELPIMGVNLGKLGFLAEYSVKELEDGFNALLKGDFIIEDRTILETKVNNTMLYALNDFVIHKRDFARMITIDAVIDNVPVAEYHADGLIIATPTGSTAYSLSSGGPIIAPNCHVIVLTPVSPHSLNMRPLVIPDTLEITLTTGTESGITSLVADGQHLTPLEPQERVVIRKSERVVKLLKRVENSYYDLLKNKLLWSIHAKQ